MKILGLDISKTSGGFTEFIDGTYTAQTHSINVEKNEENRFIKCFNSLKDFIELNYSQEEYDLVIIEDIFFESNVDTFRVLSVLNLCIDWCVDNGILKTKEYLKISNKTWKSWLFINDNLKGMEDKKRIRLNVKQKGISYDGLDGFQDMYDSTGMIMGYFQKDDIQQKSNTVKQKNNLKLSDVNCLYYLFKEELDQNLRQRGVQDKDIKSFKITRMSKNSLLEMLSKDSEWVLVSESKVNLGNLGEDLGLRPLVGGGYCAFWLKNAIESR